MSVPIIYHASYSQLALPPSHRFPINKYRDLFEFAKSQGYLNQANHFIPEKIDIEHITQVHCPQYTQQFLSGTLNNKVMRRIGFPWSEELVNRTLHAINGTCLTTQLALEHQIAIHLTGGYHHAHFAFGSGFCVFNDLVIAANQAIKTQKASKVLIFDCDVHQGDGTAALCEEQENIISCSIHCYKNFPARKMVSDHDIDLDKACADKHYLTTVKQVLPLLIRIHQPDLIIYDAGVDIHQDDDLGYLNISTAGIFQRDSFVFETAKNTNIPVAAVIGGGYSRQPQELVKRHGQLLAAANAVFSS